MNTVVTNARVKTSLSANRQARQLGSGLNTEDEWI